jgi:hypothetical protein
MKNKNKFSVFTHFWLNKILSRKLFTFLISAGFCWTALSMVLKHCYTLPPDALKQISTIYATFMGTFGLLCATYMGCNITEAKFNNIANIVGENKTIFNNEEIHEDREIHIVEEGGEGAPEVRPWSAVATDDHD